MCVIPSCTPASSENKIRPVCDLLHIEEAALFDMADCKICLLFTIVLKVSGELPATLHLTHRRGVVFEDATVSMASGRDSLLTLLHRNLRGTGYCIYGEGTDKRLQIAPLGQEDCDPLIASIPVAEILEQKIQFCPAAGSQQLPIDRKPFTIASYSPLAPREEPYALMLKIEIRKPVFDQVVPSINMYGPKYVYEMAGPEILLRDISYGDLGSEFRTAGDTFVKQFSMIVDGGKLNITSYDIISFDKALPVCQYTRAVSRAAHVLANEQIEINEKSQWVANAWHSSNPDFIILRTCSVPCHD